MKVCSVLFLSFAVFSCVDGAMQGQERPSSFSHLSSRIYNGTLSSYKRYRAVVQIAMQPVCNGTKGILKNNLPFLSCSGVLIADDLVLTAAHCIVDFSHIMRSSNCTEFLNKTIMVPFLYSNKSNTGNANEDFRIFPANWLRIYVGYPLQWLIHDVAEAEASNKKLMDKEPVVNTTGIATYVHPRFALGKDSKVMFNDLGAIRIRPIKQLVRRGHAKSYDLARKALEPVEVSFSPKSVANNRPSCTIAGWSQIEKVTTQMVQNFPEVIVNLTQNKNMSDAERQKLIDTYMPAFTRTATIQRASVAMIQHDDCFVKKLPIVEKLGVNKSHYLCLSSSSEFGSDKGESGPCKGDSGGATFCSFFGNEKELVATISFGPSSCVATDKFPAVVTRLAGYKLFYTKLKENKLMPSSVIWTGKRMMWPRDIDKSSASFTQASHTSTNVMAKITAAMIVIRASLV